ncbi:MAG: hypothetical protein WD875_06155 [Pirellulales bacterium]
MTTAVIWYGGTTPDYQADHERAQTTEKPRRSRKTTTTRRVARPVGHNGLHRRRKKRWSW